MALYTAVFAKVFEEKKCLNESGKVIKYCMKFQVLLNRLDDFFLPDWVRWSCKFGKLCYSAR